MNSLPPFTPFIPKDKKLSMANAMDKYLQEAGIDIGDMKYFLEKYEGFITGSFPLFCLLCEHKKKNWFFPNNLNIVVRKDPRRFPKGYKYTIIHEEDQTKISAYSSLQCFEDAYLDEKTLEKIKTYRPSREKKDEYRPSWDVVHVYECEKPEAITIRILVVNRSPLDYISVSDLGICHLAYDGKTFLIRSDYSVSDISKGNAKLHNYINEGYCVSKTNSTAIHILKYLKRGFKFDFESSYRGIIVLEPTTLDLVTGWNRSVTKHIEDYPYELLHPDIPVFFDAWSYLIRGNYVVGSADAPRQPGDRVITFVSFGKIKIGEGKITSREVYSRFPLEGNVDLMTARSCLFIRRCFNEKGSSLYPLLWTCEEADHNENVINPEEAVNEEFKEDLKDITYLSERKHLHRKSIRIIYYRPPKPLPPTLDTLDFHTL